MKTETTKGQDEPVKWTRVATVGGKPTASIIAGRLEVNGIPTRVTQEAAGVNVFAVNVGILGSAHIWVPEEYQEQAENILAHDWADEEE